MIDTFHQKPLLGRQINWAHPLAKGLVGCWIMNEGSGNKVYDIASHKYDLDFFNTPVWGPGKNGHSILFDDGSSEYLETSSSPIADSPMTLSAWGNTDINNAGQGLLFVGDSGDTNNYNTIILRGTGNPGLFSGNGTNTAVIDATTAYSVNTWHHVCGIIYGASGSSQVRACFIDGGNKGTTTDDRMGNIFNVTSVGRWSDSSPANYMSGKIDLPMIWNRALTDDEVEWLYREPTAMFQQNRVRWFSIPVPAVDGQAIRLRAIEKY